MKMYYFLTFFIILILLSVPAKSQTVHVDGYAFLNGQSDHSGIKVAFHRTAPMEFRDTVLTDQSGYYYFYSPTGIYDITFFKSSYTGKTVNDVMLYSDKTLDTVKLYPSGMSGSISGVLKKGDYIIMDSVWVDSSDTLKIEPGARLLFKKGTSLTVYGSLIARGTEKDSIIFTRYLEEDSNPDSVYWNGILFYGKDQYYPFNYKSILQYCHISFCKDGMAALQTYQYNTIIENSLFTNCRNFTTISYYSSCQILRNCKFEGCYPDYNKEYGSLSVLYFNQLTYEQTFDNIEITGIKNDKCSAIGLSATNALNLNNFLIHDNLGSVVYSNYNYSNQAFINSTIVNNARGISPASPGRGAFVNCIIANNPEGRFGNNIWNCDFYNSGKPDSLSAKWFLKNVQVNIKGDSCDPYGNISLNPLFVDQANKNYRLKANSPCIDAGINDSVKTGMDFNNNQRIFDGNKDGETIVDIGAYEFDAPSWDEISSFNQNFENSWHGWNLIYALYGRWEIIMDSKKAHTSDHCASIKVTTNAKSGYLQSPVIDLPLSDDIKLSFWIKSSNYSQLFGNNKNADNIQQVTSLLYLYFLPGGSFSSMEQVYYTTNEISDSWTEITLNLINYAGRRGSLMFMGTVTNMLNTTELLIDDIELKATTGIEAPYIDPAYSGETIYPNPASDYIILPAGENFVTLSASIYNLFGEKVIGVDNFAESSRSVDISALPAGVYYVVIQTEKGVERKRFIVRR